MTRADHEIPFEDLPEGFAENVEHPPETPATPRPAATIVLLRDGEEGLELLLMRRNRKAGFVPGAYVFPGGRVDRGDAGEALVARVDALSPETAARRLAMAGAEPPAIAYYLAAVREAFEETGILVARRADGSAPPTAAEDADVDALREELMEDLIGLDEVLDALECRIDGRALEYLAHWITPEPEPRRYDTRFFAARVPRGATPVIDPREMTDGLWLTPSDALRRNDGGSLPMVFPTIKTLEQLEPYGDARTALAKLGRREVPAIMPRLVVTPTGIGMELEDGE